MSRDELEALIWGELAGCGSPRQQTTSVLKILAAADRYAAARYAAAMNEHAAELHSARTDIGRQPTYGTARRTA